MSMLFIVKFCLVLVSSTSAFEDIFINDCVGLQNVNFNLAASYIVTDHIDCGNSSEWNKGAGFVPIGSSSTVGFCGTFDGQNHTIENLFINRPDESQVGLFAQLCDGASLQSIILLNITIRGDQKVGGLIGQNYGSIFNIAMTGKVSGSYIVGGLVGFDEGQLRQIEFIGEVLGQALAERLGGLIGESYGVLTRGFADVNVTGNLIVGGVVGVNGGQANTVQFTGYVIGIGLSDFLGGVVGYNMGIINDAKANGSVTGGENVGGVCGYNEGDITFSEFSGNVTGTNAASLIGGFVGYQTINGFIGNSKAIGIVEGQQFVGGFAGSSSGMLESITFEGQVIGKNQNEQIGGLIGLHGNTGNLINGRVTGVVGGEESVGGVVGVNIGNITSVEFRGIIYGYTQAKYIGGVGGMQGGTGHLSDAKSNAIINGTYFMGGIFGLNRGVLKNTLFTGTIIGEKDSMYVGGAIGFNERTLQHIHINSLITVKGTMVGGAVGENTYTGMMQNVTVIVNLTVRGNHVGGVVGNNLGSLYYCCAEGSVIADRYVGGISGSNGIAGVISSSYAMVNITSQTGYAGGLIGYHEGVLEFSYSLGPVTANQTAGSLVGYFDGHIQDSYAAGCVIALVQTGGLVGSELAEDQVAHSYWNLHTTGQRYPAGQDYDAILNRYGLTTEQMLNPTSFKSWDYEETWDQQPGASFPYLKNFVPSVLPTAPTLVCPMEPLPYETWMDPLVIFLISYLLTLLTILLVRRMQSQNQLHSVFKACENWVFSETRMGNLALMDYLVNEITLSRDYDPKGYSKLEVAARSDSTNLIPYWLAKLDASKANQKDAAYAIAQDLQYTNSMGLLKPDNEDETSTTASTLESSGGLRSRSINQDDSATVPLLVDSSASLSIDSQLYAAAVTGNIDKVKDCLRQGAEPNRRNQNGTLPFFAAALNYHENVVLLLIEHGANPYLRNSEQQTIVECLFASNLCMVAEHILRHSQFSIAWSLSKQIYLKALEDQSQHLTELNLSGYGLSDGEFVQFIAVLQDNAVVKKFNAAYNQITGHGLHDSASFLSANKTLSLLDLRCNLLTLKGVCDFKVMLGESSLQVIMSDNLLLPMDHQDWQSLTVTTNFRHKPASQAYLQAKLIWQHFCFNALIGSFLIVANRIASGYLIQAYDKERDHFPMWMSVGLLCLSYIPGLYALRYLYGGWWLRNWRDGVEGLFLLPGLSPELLSYIYEVRSPDIILTLLEVNGLVCETLIAILALIIKDHEDFQPALFKILMTVALIFHKCLGYAYWLETLKAQWHHWRKSKGRSLRADRRGSQMMQVN